MKIKLKLKNQDEINKLLEVSDIEGEEGIKHTNGISWKDNDCPTFEIINSFVY